MSCSVIREPTPGARNPATWPRAQTQHFTTVALATTALRQLSATLTQLSQRRAQAISALREDGLSFSTIAQETGLSKARIAQVVRSEVERHGAATRGHHSEMPTPCLYRIDLYTLIRGLLMTDPSSTSPDATFDLALLDQDTQWTDEHGTTSPISELDEDSCTQLARWLLRNARHFYLQVLSGRLLNRALEDHAVDDMVFLDAATWMRTRPLHRALIARQDLLARVGPVCSAARATERLGLTSETELSQLARDGEILVLTTSDDACICPLWQFTKSDDGTHWGTRHAVRAMLIHLGDIDPWTVAALFNVPAPELDGRTPRDVIGDREPPIAQLETLARHVAAEAR